MGESPGTFITTGSPGWICAGSAGNRGECGEAGTGALGGGATLALGATLELGATLTPGVAWLTCFAEDSVRETG